MNSFLVTLASSDPMSHVLDKWLIEGVFSKHALFVTIAAALCVLVLPMVANRIAADGTGGRIGGFFEVILCFVRDEVAVPFLGEDDARKYLWIIWSFFCFILCCNLLGMIPVYGASPTGNVFITAALALAAFITYNILGIKRNGFVKYMKGTFLVGPPLLWPMMIIIEALGFVIKPVALAIRLFANMMAGHVMLAVIIGLGVMMGPWVGIFSSTAAVALTFLEILVAFIQAFIFTFLTTVFLSMALHPDH